MQVSGHQVATVIPRIVPITNTTVRATNTENTSELRADARVSRHLPTTAITFHVPITNTLVPATGSEPTSAVWDYVTVE